MLKANNIGILTFISMTIDQFWWFRPKTIIGSGYYDIYIYKHFKFHAKFIVFHAQLSWAWKKKLHNLMTPTVCNVYIALPFPPM